MIADSINLPLRNLPRFPFFFRRPWYSKQIVINYNLFVVKCNEKKVFDILPFLVYLPFSTSIVSSCLLVIELFVVNIFLLLSKKNACHEVLLKHVK